MSADPYALLDELKQFCLERLNEDANPKLGFERQRAAKSSIRWVLNAVNDAKTGPDSALEPAVASLARIAKRYRDHPGYDPLWDSIDTSGGLGNP